MKITTFGLILVATFLLLRGRGYAQEKKPAEAPKELVERVVVITDVKDVDNLEGYVPSTKKRVVRIALGNLLPYAKWPKDLSKKDEEIKQNGLKFMKDVLIGQKMIFWGIDKGDVLHGDLRNWEVYQAGREGPFQYDSNKPSGTMAWFTVYFNAMMLEKGHTVYAPDPEPLNFSVTKPRELNRAKFFAEAETYAIENKAGLWKDGKESPLGMKLKEIAGPKKASK